MSKRVIVTVNVPEDADLWDLATQLACALPADDPTVWEWPDFWADLAEGLIGPDVGQDPLLL